MNFILHSIGILLSLAIEGQASPPRFCVSNNAYPSMFGTSFRAEYLRRAADMALSNSDRESTTFLSASSDSEFLKLVRSHVENGCKVLVGVFTSRECLLAGPVLKEKGAFLLSPTCGHDRIGDYFPAIRALVPPTAQFSEKIGNYLSSHPQAQIIIFVQPTDAFSKVTLEGLKEYIRTPTKTIAVDHDGIPDIREVKQIDPTKSRIFVFTTYPVASVATISQLDRQNLLNTRSEVVASTSWAFDRSSLRNSFTALRKTKGVLQPTIFSHKKMLESEFAQAYKAKFQNEVPSGLHLMFFDAMKFGIRCFKEATNENSTFSYENYNRCLLSGHNGIAGKLKFEKTSPFAVRTPVLEKMIFDEERQ